MTTDADSKSSPASKSRQLDGMLEAAVERFARRTFEESVNRVDAAARSRLTRARFRALEELQPSRGRSSRRRGKGVFVTDVLRRRRGIACAAAGTTAAVALALFIALRQGSGPVDEAQLAAYGDLEWLAGTEELELLEEDLEFYAWLAQQPELAPSNEPRPR